MKLNERRKHAALQIENQLKAGTKPTKKSAQEAKDLGFKKYNGKYVEPLNEKDIAKKQSELATLKQRIK